MAKKILKAAHQMTVFDLRPGAMVERDYKAGFFVDLAWMDLGLGLELADATGAKTGVGREAWKLYGQAREAGLGTLDTLGLLALLEPRP